MMVKKTKRMQVGLFMKLLIVDDEELTRSGLVSSIDWEKLGITEIRQASDGIYGLQEARDFLPDIVLCDVRMPRMNGITMLEQIETFLPQVAGIFMSGYSDKEYLKAAIKLKAINYIEKPIDPAEIAETIQKAVEQCQKQSLEQLAASMNLLQAARKRKLQNQIAQLDMLLGI